MVVKEMPMTIGRAPTRRQLITGGALAFVGAALHPSPVLAEPSSEVSHTAEAIHQERQFKASPKRVYEALTVSEQFAKVTQLSAVMQAAVMAKMHKPTQVSQKAGSAFALFGGYIVGRQIELIPNKLIVQAWRARSWEPGIYSVATFAFSGDGAGTKLVFDHAGFPRGQAEHLASGWQGNYWEPLEKFLGA